MARKRRVKKLADRLKIVQKVYEDPRSTGSYGSRRRLEDTLEKRKTASKKDAEKFLSESDSYTLHHQRRVHFPRSMTIVSGIDKQWQADLADMSNLAKDNDGVHFLLTVVDCFSKYAWVIPIKKKAAVNMLEAFTKLFTQSAPRVPEKLQTDKGTEFYNASIKRLLEEKNVHLFSTSGDTKAAMVERFNRTLKHRIYEYLTAKNTRRYVDKLDDFVHSYNNSVHRTIGMTPTQVKPKHEAAIYSRVYGNYYQRLQGHH